jgi:hypothetical protein
MGTTGTGGGRAGVAARKATNMQGGPIVGAARGWGGKPNTAPGLRTRAAPAPTTPQPPQAAVHVVRLDMRDLEAVKALPASLPPEFREVRAGPSRPAGRASHLQSSANGRALISVQLASLVSRRRFHPWQLPQPPARPRQGGPLAMPAALPHPAHLDARACPALTAHAPPATATRPPRRMQVDILVNNAGLALGVNTVEAQEEEVGGGGGPGALERGHPLPSHGVPASPASRAPPLPPHPATLNPPPRAMM